MAAAPDVRHLAVRAADTSPCSYGRCRDQIEAGARAIAALVGQGSPGSLGLYHAGCYADELLAWLDLPARLRPGDPPAGPPDPLGRVGAPGDPLGRWGARRDQPD